MALAIAAPTLFRGRAAGGFEDGLVVSARDGQTMQLADVNADGNVDLLLFDGQTLTVALGDGHGRFDERPSTTFPVLGRIRPMVVGRFTTGGKVDVLAFDDQGGSIFTLKGHGDGTFDAPVKLSITAGAIGTHPLVVDLDRDGNDDVVLLESPIISGVTILHNKGDGTFEKTIVVAGNQVDAIAVADINGDEIDDLAMIIGSRVTIASGLGSLRFADPGQDGRCRLRQGRRNVPERGWFGRGADSDHSAVRSKRDLEAFRRRPRFYARRDGDVADGLRETTRCAFTVISAEDATSY